jgi:hypothetical protein
LLTVDPEDPFSEPVVVPVDGVLDLHRSIRAP